MRGEAWENSSALLEGGVRALGLTLPAAAPERMLDYLAELEKWNKAYNLTAVRDPAQMVTRHLLDSLALLPAMPQPALRLLDAGSGAGLPGLPLALARTGWSVTLLDGNGKKARFLRHVQRLLKIGNLEVAESRAESYRPSQPFDCVIARAFAALPDFLRHTAHLAGAGGHWLAMKGKLDKAELENIPPEFHIVEIKPLTIPGLREARHLIAVSRLPSPVSRPS